MKTKSVFVAAAAVLTLGALNACAAIVLTDNVAYTQDFDSLASAGSSSVMPTDWVFSETGTNANATYTAGTGSSTTGDTYSFGSTASGERALGGLFSGSLTPTVGVSFSNNVGTPTIDLLVSYIGEQWRLGAAGRMDRLDFQYSTNATSVTTGTWTDFNALDFTAPVTAGATSALDGNAIENKTSVAATIGSITVANGANFWLRWADFNATGSDDGLAVDDFSITAVPEPAAALLGSLGVLALLRRRRD